MDFDLSDDQRQIKDSVDRFLADAYPDLKKRGAARNSAGGFSRENWAKYAELGLTSIPFAEEHGGLGAGLVETSLVMEAIGQNLAVDPYLSTIVLGGGLIRHSGNSAAQGKLIPEIIEGKRLVAFAQQERQSRFDLTDVKTTAKADGGGYLLDGEKVVVLGGDSADTLVVTARVSGGQRERNGVGLFLVDGKAAGVTRKGYPTQDGFMAADVTLKGAKAEALVAPGAQALAVAERVIDEAIAAIAAESIGAMAALHEMTVDYLKTRKQFGVPIGSFQVLQHKSVDMFTALEQARSMAYYATMMAGDENVAERRKAMSAVKVQIGQSAKFIGETATQLHGGIAMTMEYKGGHYFKRLTMIDLLFGHREHHLRLLAREGGLINPPRAA
jgi:pimeloyl-CoA dehydrogenase small subunit